MKGDYEMKKTIQDWQEEMMENTEGTVIIACIMDTVPHNPGTKRYQVFNIEGTFDELFDVTLDDDGYIINIE